MGTQVRDTLARLRSVWSKEEAYRSFLEKVILISWRLITLQYCSGFCHTLT